MIAGWQKGAENREDACLITPERILSDVRSVITDPRRHDRSPCLLLFDYKRASEIEPMGFSSWQHLLFPR
jgi:hypothetical protein